MSRRTTLLLLLALSASHAQAANLVASVDRSRLNSGETVEVLENLAAAVRKRRAKRQEA